MHDPEKAIGEMLDKAKTAAPKAGKARRIRHTEGRGGISV